MKYKCHRCFVSFENETGICPECNQADQVSEMCPKDHCQCSHDITESLAYCPECGAAMCPVCGCHDVSQISRITGYMADVAGFNAGKRAELKDRTRYTIN